MAPGTTAFVLAYLGQKLVVKILTTYANIVNNHHSLTFQLLILVILGFVMQISGCGPPSYFTSQFVAWKFLF